MATCAARPIFALLKRAPGLVHARCMALQPSQLAMQILVLDLHITALRIRCVRLCCLLNQPQKVTGAHVAEAAQQLCAMPVLCEIIRGLAHGSQERSHDTSTEHKGGEAEQTDEQSSNQTQDAPAGSSEAADSSADELMARLAAEADAAMAADFADTWAAAAAESELITRSEAASPSDSSPDVAIGTHSLHADSAAAAASESAAASKTNAPAAEKCAASCKAHPAVPADELVPELHPTIRSMLGSITRVRSHSAADYASILALVL